MDCLEFFNNHRENAEKCKLLQGNPKQALVWESVCSASEHSPGKVLEAERLLRLVFTPIHFDEETGKIKPALFDDASNKGLSVNRADYIDLLALIERGLTKAAKDRESKPDRQFYGIALAHCADIRKILSETTQARAFCVFDTALADDISHADVCQIVSGKQEGRSVRARLYDAFGRIQQHTDSPASQ